MKIKKAKISKGWIVETTFIDTDGNEIAMKGKNKCHADMRAAFDALVPFFADLTEQKEAEHIDWNNIDGDANADLLRKISVSSLSIGGDDNNRIITVSGKRTLITSRILNLNSPGVEMDSESFEWDHIDEFDEAVNHVLYEVEQYIVNRKWDVENRLEFDSDADDPFAEPDSTDEVDSVA